MMSPTVTSIRSRQSPTVTSTRPRKSPTVSSIKSRKSPTVTSIRSRKSPTVTSMESRRSSSTLVRAKTSTVTYKGDRRASSKEETCGYRAVSYPVSRAKHFFGPLVLDSSSDEDGAYERKQNLNVSEHQIQRPRSALRIDTSPSQTLPCFRRLESSPMAQMTELSPKFKKEKSAKPTNCDKNKKEKNAKPTNCDKNKKQTYQNLQWKRRQIGGSRNREPTILKELIRYCSVGNYIGVLRVLRQSTSGTFLDRKGGPEVAPPLTYASLKGNTRVVQALIDAKAGLDKGNADGETTLMRLARVSWEGGEKAKSRMKVMRLLVNARASVNKKSRSGHNALFLATANENLDVVRYLIEDASAFDSPSNSMSAIGAAKARSKWFGSLDLRSPSKIKNERIIAYLTKANLKRKNALKALDRDLPSGLFACLKIDLLEAGAGSISSDRSAKTPKIFTFHSKDVEVFSPEGKRELTTGYSQDIYAF
ncbi:hypothetical protein AAMO2058_001180500 [Amorphochlora amoebiformis]